MIRPYMAGVSGFWPVGMVVVQFLVYTVEVELVYILAVEEMMSGV